MPTNWNGARVTKLRARIIARDHGICWLCQHPGATTTDHVIPKSQRPDLTWQPDNLRAAHAQAAGKPDGCQTPDCHCPGNYGRKTRPPDQQPTRRW